MYRTQIFDITRKFNEDDWSVFIRDKLNLDDETIDQIEDSQASRSEKKYRTAKKWMNLGEESNNLEKLCSLSGISVEIENAKEVELKATPAISAEVSWRERPEKKKGCALIISNGFENVPNMRRVKASEADLKHMEDLWKTEMSCSLYENKVHENLSADEMKQKLKGFAKIKDCDYMVVYISTHGIRKIDNSTTPATQSDRIFGEDQETISGKELLTCFEENKINHENITKFFILDYCRDDGMKEKSDPSGRYVVRPDLPLQNNTITIYATHRDYAAADTDSGSILTTALSDVFKKNWQTHSLTSMLMMVNSKTKEDAPMHNLKSMSIFESSLVDDFTFL